VSVKANYGAEAVKRVIEYVEFQDENGESGYPTLSVEGGFIPYIAPRN
jgi:hypothetical protein